VESDFIAILVNGPGRDLPESLWKKGFGIDWNELYGLDRYYYKRKMRQKMKPGDMCS